MKRQSQRQKLNKLAKIGAISLVCCLIFVMPFIYLKSTRNDQCIDKASREDLIIEFLSILYSKDSIFSAKNRVEQSFAFPISIVKFDDYDYSEYISKFMSYQLAAFEEMPYKFYSDHNWFIRLVIEPSFRYPYLIRLIPEEDVLLLTLKRLPWANQVDLGPLETYEFRLDYETNEQLLKEVMLLQNFHNYESAKTYPQVTDGDAWMFEILNEKGKYHNIYHHARTELPDEQEFFRLCNALIDITLQLDLPTSVREALEFYKTYDYSRPMNLPF